jgi:hypothetical protein
MRSNKWKGVNRDRSRSPRRSPCVEEKGNRPLEKREAMWIVMEALMGDKMNL